MNCITVKLSNGREVLAKLYHGQPMARTYANLMQARRAAEQAGDGWTIIGRWPFYVAREVQS